MSVIMLPIEHLPAFLILLRTLYSAVLRLHEPVPLGPLRILHLHVPLLVGVPLFEPNQLVEIRQHVDEDAALDLALVEVFEGELDAVVGFEDVHHLADDVLEIEI
jgi:hypothetical protein